MGNRVLLSFVVVAVCIFSLPLVHAESTSPYSAPADTGYGEKRPVTTIEEAKKVLAGYFSKKDVKIGEIKEQELFFEAEIRDRNNNLVDKVIIDKRTGRIRSTY